MAPFLRPAAVLMSTIALLTGCATPPQGVGETSQILAGADEPTADFAIVPVTRDTLPMISSWPGQPAPLKTAGWLPPGRGIKQEIIAPGDRVDVTIWSNEENGLLTEGGQKNTPLTGLKISQDGTLFLPYAGSVKIADMTVDQARQAIQDKLTAVIPSAQVVLIHSAGRENAVQVVAGLPQAGSVGMPDHAFSMLDLISNAGGIPAGMANPQIQVQRDGRLYSIAFADLVQHPEKDAILKPGDRIIVTPETRYFRSFGAAGREAQVVFPMPKVTALDAVSIIGGLNEFEADAKSVLVLRNYPASAVRKDGKGPTQERTIFAIDLTSADGMFSAGEFNIEDKDTIVVAQSPLMTQNAIIAYVQKLLALPINVLNVPLTVQKF